MPYDQTSTFLVQCNQNVIDACFEGLIYWHRGNVVLEEEETTSPVTYRRLLEAMEEADLRAPADDLRKKISKKYKSALQSCKSSHQGSLPSSLTIYGIIWNITFIKNNNKIRMLYEVMHKYILSTFCVAKV